MENIFRANLNVPHQYLGFFPPIILQPFVFRIFSNFYKNTLKSNAKKIPKYSVANLDNMNLNSGKLFVFALIGKRNIKYLNCLTHFPQIFLLK